MPSCNHLENQALRGLPRTFAVQPQHYPSARPARFPGRDCRAAFRKEILPDYTGHDYDINQ
jgi:hypothetical protein